MFLLQFFKLPFCPFLAMNINSLNDLFPIVPYGSSSDDESTVDDMDVVVAPPSAERGEQNLQQTTNSRVNFNFYML